MFYIGCHLSCAKGFLPMAKDAEKIGATAFQFFTRNPRGGNARALDDRDIEAFLKIARDKGLRAVHLYTDKTNKSAIQMYEKAGFIPYVCENEPRPSDVHLICRFEEVL